MITLQPFTTTVFSINKSSLFNMNAYFTLPFIQYIQVTTFDSWYYMQNIWSSGLKTLTALNNAFKSTTRSANLLNTFYYMTHICIILQTDITTGNQTTKNQMYACLNQEDSMKGQLQSEPFANVPCLVNKNLQLKTKVNRISNNLIYLHGQGSFKHIEKNFSADFFVFLEKHFFES